MKNTATKILSLLVCAALLFAGCQTGQSAQGQPTQAATAEATEAPEATATPEATTEATQEGSATPEASADGVNPAGSFPIVNDKITIKTYFTDNTSWCDYSSNNRALQNYESKTNIHLDLVFGDQCKRQAQVDERH